MIIQQLIVGFDLHPRYKNLLLRVGETVGLSGFRHGRKLLKCELVLDLHGALFLCKKLIYVCGTSQSSHANLKKEKGPQLRLFY